MRKLSKKISMLMVLAMLVSLFSGVVSASAASVWSFYNKTADDSIVAYAKETYKMENDQFADFDLYKSDEIVDTDVYTVVYESSDEEVVWVNAKNGKLRAQKDAEIGATAEITAHITNKVTGAEADRSFTIEIVAAEVEEVEYAIVSNIGEETYLTGEKYELEAVVTADGEEIEAEVVFSIDGVAIEGAYAPTKAGTYTIVATATIDGEEYAAEFEVVVEESIPEIAEAKQVSLTAVEITFNNEAWAAKAVADQAITVAQVIGEIEVAELVKGIEAKKDAADTVVVTLFNNMAKDATYKFAFAGYECAATVKGAGDTPASIAVVGGKVPKNQTKMADIKVYNSLGIDITSIVSKNVTYSLVGDNYDVDVQADGSIYFFEAGKQAVIKAVFDMGWDNEGNEIKDLEATGVYNSVEEYTYSAINGYALTVGDKVNGDLTYTTGTLKLSLSDECRKLYAKYDQVSYEGKKEALYISGGEYSYYSTNESVLLVEPATGELKPCKEGYASIYLKKNNAVVGSVSIKVEAGRTLSVFTASIADKKLATAIADDSTVIAVSTKDQFQDAYNAVSYSYTLVTKVENATALEDFFTISDVNDGKITLTLKDDAKALIKNGNVQTLAFTIKADAGNNNVKSQNLSVTIRNNSDLDPKTSTLEVSADEIDLALNKKNDADYNATIKLVNVDDKGYDLGLENIALEAEATTGNAYSVVITKVGDNKFDVTNSEFFSVSGNVITIDPVKSATSKLATGTYRVQLYKLNGSKMQVIKNDTIVIKDTTPAITAKVVKTNTLDMKSALEFYINGVKVESDNIIGDVVISDSVQLSGGTKEYVNKVKVTLSTKALNKDSALGWNFEKEVTVGQLFVVQ